MFSSSNFVNHHSLNIYCIITIYLLFKNILFWPLSIYLTWSKSTIKSINSFPPHVPENRVCPFLDPWSSPPHPFLDLWCSPPHTLFCAPSLMLQGNSSPFEHNQPCLSHIHMYRFWWINHNEILNNIHENTIVDWHTLVWNRVNKKE